MQVINFLTVGIVGSMVCSFIAILEPQPFNPKGLTELKIWGEKSSLGDYMGVVVAIDRDTNLNGEIELIGVKIDGRKYSKGDFTPALALYGKINPGDRVACLRDGIADRVKNGKGRLFYPVWICKKKQ